MYNKLPKIIAVHFAARGLISENDISWCAYLLIRWFGSATLCLILFAIATVLGRSVELFFFCFCLFALRRRIGGWHAESAWICQLVSVSSTLFFVYIVGPLCESQPASFAIFGCLIVTICAFILRPVYPPQTHFSQAVHQANIRKKNILLIWIIAVQIVSIPIADLTVMIHCTLGIFVALISLIAEAYNQKIKGGNNNEENGSCTEGRSKCLNR